MKNSIYLLVLIQILLSCTTDKKEEKESAATKEQQSLVGTWANLSLLVTMKHLDQDDSLLHAKEGEWEEVLKIKPIETTFNSDSTFSSEYFTIEGQNFNTTKGKWWIENDSLVMLTEDGLTRYFFEMKLDRVRFRTTLDWDGDGHVDDSYDGVQVRID